MARKKPGRKKHARKIGTVDFETDPFLAGRYPEPFVGCLYFGPDEFYVVWGDNPQKEIARLLRDQPPCDVYAHNGGKFDFHFLLPYVDKAEAKIIHGRLALLNCGNAKLIDSMLLIPVGLGKFKKTAIDYNLLEEAVREENREEIINYLIDDCRYLLELVTGFHEKVGKKLTIGAAAMGKVKESGAIIERQGRTHDETFRPYYFGGRVEAIRPGVHTGKFTCIDLNSAYPASMLLQHPLGNKNTYTGSSRLPAMKELGPQFLHVMAKSDGALPWRDERGNLQFPRDGIEREYKCTGWEIKAGLQTKTIEITDVIRCLSPERTQNFAAFVLNEYGARQVAKKEKRGLDELVHKLVLNSGYGKFATNPDKFYQWTLTEPGDAPDTESESGWELYSDGPGVWIWRTPADAAQKERGYYDVACGASITGAVRATLWRALCAVKNPFYCDTDSIICNGPGKLEMDETKLGAWKVEQTGDWLAIAGKKLYALESFTQSKKASKGARLDSADIFEVAAGKEIIWQNTAPTYSVRNGAHFVERRINRSK